MKSYFRKDNLNTGLDILQIIYIFCISLVSSIAVSSRAVIPSHEDAIRLTNGLSHPMLIFLAKLRLYLKDSPSLGMRTFAFILLLYIYYECKLRTHVRDVRGGNTGKIPSFMPWQ